MAAWAKAMLDMTAHPDPARRANAEFTEYVAPLVEERRSRPGTDLLSAIVTEEVDGQRLDDDEVFGFLRLLFPAGVDTTWQRTANSSPPRRATRSLGRTLAVMRSVASRSS